MCCIKQTLVTACHFLLFVCLHLIFNSFYQSGPTHTIPYSPTRRKPAWGCRKGGFYIFHMGTTLWKLTCSRVEAPYHRFWRTVSQFFWRVRVWNPRIDPDHNQSHSHWFYGSFPSLSFSLPMFFFSYLLIGAYSVMVITSKIRLFALSFTLISFRKAWIHIFSPSYG